MSYMDKEKREKLRRKIALQTQDYLNKGHRIQEIPTGVSGISGLGENPLSFRISDKEPPPPRNNALFLGSKNKKEGDKK